MHAISRRAKHLAFSYGIVLAGVCLILAIPAPEPRYNGRPLSEWVQLGYKNQDAQDAIRHIGTNALPLTLKWLRFEPSAQMASLYSKMENAPSFLRPRWLLDILDEKKQKQLSHSAPLVLVVLGPRARPVARDLLTLSYDTNRPDASYEAIEALGCLETNGFPELIHILKDPKHPHAPAAARVIGQVMESDSFATSAIPALLDSISGLAPDSLLVHQVAEALYYSPPDKQQFEVFSRLATNSDEEIRAAASIRLQDFVSPPTHSTPPSPQTTNAAHSPLPSAP